MLSIWSYKSVIVAPSVAKLTQSRSVVLQDKERIYLRGHSFHYLVDCRQWIQCSFEQTSPRSLICFFDTRLLRYNIRPTIPATKKEAQIYVFFQLYPLYIT
jgi:hypothetical protein